VKAALSLITAGQNASGVLTGFDALPSSLSLDKLGIVSLSNDSRLTRASS
jgi:hypothetical protein